jgi:uncharacterized membrane protein YedE/YeeE
MYLNWKIGGLALGLVFLLATAVVKPIGVSTQFVIVDGLLASLFDEQIVQTDANSKSGYASSNAYLNKSGGKYAKHAAEPLNYGLVFVLSMALGGLISRFSSTNKRLFCQQMPDFHKHSFFGSNMGLRYLLAFIGGILVLWGARLAGGCTSGHMMSGMMQTSVSAYLFTVSAFAAAVPVSLLLYKTR